MATGKIRTDIIYPSDTRTRELNLTSVPAPAIRCVQRTTPVPTIRGYHVPADTPIPARVPSRWRRIQASRDGKSPQGSCRSRDRAPRGGG